MCPQWKKIICYNYFLKKGISLNAHDTNLKFENMYTRDIDAGKRVSDFPFRSKFF